jgi:hypothetical protein
MTRTLLALLLSLLLVVPAQATVYWFDSFDTPCWFCNWTDYGLGTSGFSLDSTNPAHGTHSLKMTYPNGGFIDRFMGTKHNQFNVKFKIRLDSGWTTDAINSKIIYVRADTSPSGTPNGVLEMVFGGTGLVFTLQGAFDRSDTEILNLNIPLTTSWQEVEFQWIMNTPGSSNGSMTAWLNGVQTFNETGRAYRGTTDPTGANTYVDNVRNYIQAGTGSLHLDEYSTGNERLGGGGSPPPPPPVPPPPVPPPPGSFCNCTGTN